MRHRHKLSQRQRQRAAPQSRHAEAQETDEQLQAGSSRPKKGATPQMHAEGNRPRPRLDKFRRGGRSRNRYDNGGPAGSTAGSTRSADDPGGELAAATKERKSTAGRIQDELFGPRSAYARGGRQKQRHYDDGGLVDDSDAAPSTGGSSLGSDFGNALSGFGSGLAAMAKARGSGPPPVPIPSSSAPQANNPSFIRQQQSAQKSQALLARIKALEAGGQPKSLVPGAQTLLQPQRALTGNKQGGRIHKNRAREK
jgi:hypothetical protein